jgi:hypothetical protein
LTTKIPIWVRVPAIIALVLVGVLITTMLLDAGGGAGGHGTGGGHGSGDEMQMTDHNAETGPGASSEPHSGE